MPSSPPAALLAIACALAVSFTPAFALAAEPAAASAAPAAAATQTGIAARELQLLAEPRNGAAVVGRLASGARFELLAREKFWARVAGGGAQGWVQAFYLSWGAAPAAQGASAGQALSEVVSLGAKRDDGRIVATLGARGLTEEQLKAAKFNEAEVKKLESLAASPQDAAAFAAQGSLAAQKVDYLGAPNAAVDAGGPR